VSFYKGIGTLHGLWPGAASALSCLRRRLPLMPDYLGRAREIASVLRGTRGFGSFLTRRTSR
jgi:hypothetical protein